MMSNNFGGGGGGAGFSTWHSMKLILNTKKSIKYINNSI